MPSFVLASTSPRLAALLSDAGFQFEIAPPRLAEKFDAALTIRELTQWNAVRKGMSIAQVDPLDKAGAYAAQGSGAEIIAKISGSFTNVVGLPMEKTIDALAKFGIRPRKS